MMYMMYACQILLLIRSFHFIFDLEFFEFHISNSFHFICQMLFILNLTHLISFNLHFTNHFCSIEIRFCCCRCFSFRLPLFAFFLNGVRFKFNFLLLFHFFSFKFLFYIDSFLFFFIFIIFCLLSND